MDTLLFTVGKSFCRQSLSEASFNLENLQLTMQTFVLYPFFPLVFCCVQIYILFV